MLLIAIVTSHIYADSTNDSLPAQCNKQDQGDSARGPGPVPEVSPPAPTHTPGDNIRVKRDDEHEELLGQSGRISPTT